MRKNENMRLGEVSIKKNKSMTSEEIYIAQKTADIRFHKDRIKWLSAVNPVYADGVPVNRHDVQNMLIMSQACLADATGMVGLNLKNVEE